MAGLHGFKAWPDRSAVEVQAAHAQRAVLCVLLVWLLPNTQQFLHRYRPALGMGKTAGGMRRRWWQWRPTVAWTLFTTLLLLVVVYQFDKVSEFIYFQF